MEARWLTANEYADGMIEHDGHVGQLLKNLDDLGLTENTIVIYTTDNGPHHEPGRTCDDSVPQREEFELGRAPFEYRR